LLDVAGIALKIETSTSANDRYPTSGETIMISLERQNIHLIQAPTDGTSKYLEQF